MSEIIRNINNQEVTGELPKTGVVKVTEQVGRKLKTLKIGINVYTSFELGQITGGMVDESKLTFKEGYFPG
ncbi:hypothetical protein M0P65_01270 [Candidatus Gracilibacteria bacterium]|nr:hypothetical protein [Candidatus Gracilibacteria bacterium]